MSLNQVPQPIGRVLEQAVDAFQRAPHALYGVDNWSGVSSIGNFEYRSSRGMDGDSSGWSFSLEYGYPSLQVSWLQVSTLSLEYADDDLGFVLESAIEELKITTRSQQSPKLEAANFPHRSGSPIIRPCRYFIDGRAVNSNLHALGNVGLVQEKVGDAFVRAVGSIQNFSQVNFTEIQNLDKYVQGFRERWVVQR